MSERWQCGHCGGVIEIPNEQTEHDAYIDTIMRIREHRFGHIADAFAEGTHEAMMGLCEDRPSRFDPFNRSVTSNDVAPALAEVDRILRGQA